jgi:hypothetical protein
MHRIYEILKLVFREKINVFIKGAMGGWILSGVLLFGSTIHDSATLLLTYLMKLFAVTVCGLFSGFATVMGNDLYKWAKEKVVKRKIVIRTKRKKAA